MRIKVEIDQFGNCTKHCPFVQQNGKGIPIMVGGGLCVYMCPYIDGMNKDRDTQEMYINCNHD